MFKSRSLRNIVLFVLAGTVCFGGSAFAAESSDELLGLIPAESIFTVWLNNFDLALNQLDSYLAGVSPMPMGFSVMARMQFAGILGSPELKGVNTAGNFAACALAKPGQTEPAIRVLVPISDYAQFVSGNPNVGQPDANGISKVTVDGRTLAMVKNVGNYAVFTKAGDPLNVDVTQCIEASMDTAEKTIATSQPIYAYVNVQKVGEIYGDLAIEQIKKSKTKMADVKVDMAAALVVLENRRAQIDVNDPNQKATIEQLDKRIASMKDSIEQFESNPMMDNIGNIIDVYVRIVETLLNETRSFSLAIEPKADILTILETYTAMPGSDSAGILVADASAAKAGKLVNYLQDGAMLNFACRLNKPLLRKFYGDQICLMGVMTAGKMSEQDVANMKETALEVIDSLGGAVAMSLWTDKTTSPPFMEDCIIEVSDAEKFNQAILKAVELWNNGGLMNFYKEMGLRMSYVTHMNIYEYKQAKVNSAALTFETTDPNSQEAQVIEKMYGDAFEYRWAVVDGLCVEAIAGDVDAAVKQLIDEVKAGGSTEAASDIKQAMTMLGDAADDFLGTFNVVRMLEMMSVMPSFPIRDIAVESRSNIAFGGKIADEKVILKVAVPKTHVNEIMSVFMPKPQIAK